MVMAVNACTFIADDPPYPPMEHIGMEIVFIYSTEGWFSVLDSFVERAFDTSRLFTYCTTWGQPYLMIAQKTEHAFYEHS